MFHRVAIQTQKKHRVQTKMFHRGYKMIRRRCLLLPRHKNILVQTQTKMTRRICVSQRTKMLHHVLRHRCVILSRPRCLFHLVQSAAASALRVSRLPSPTSSPPPATLHQVGVQTHKPTSSRPLCHTTPMAPLPNTTPKTATPGPAERGCAYIWRRPRQERSLGRGRVGNGVGGGESPCDRVPCRGARWRACQYAGGCHHRRGALQGSYTHHAQRATRSSWPVQHTQTSSAAVSIKTNWQH